tara:strand:- start:16 stop:198 length:183 start_codon:yes stop_codon:yes gene_type:complete
MNEQDRILMEMQLNNVCQIVKGKWFRTETLNSRGERTSRIIIEYTTPEHSDAGGNDGTDS